jgi:hypothetical protein
LLADNEVQLSTAELRANTAEELASTRENELKCVEAAIRIHLLDGEAARLPRFGRRRVD